MPDHCQFPHGRSLRHPETYLNAVGIAHGRTGRVLVNAPSERSGEHARDFEIAAYLDRRLSGPDREHVEAHLAECAECRQELHQVHQFLHRSGRPRRLVVGAGLLAAAASLLLFLRPSPVDPLRVGGTEPTLAAYGPTGDAALASLRFVWAAAPGATTYRLTISGGNGVPVWSGSVADTIFALPDSVTLDADQRYVWIADALLGNGLSRSTGLQEFRPVP